MNDDEWLMRQLELEGDDDCVLAGNLVRIPEEEVEKILSSPMNDDEEWLKRQRDLIGDDDFILGGNLVRIPEEEVERILSSQMNDENSELTDTTRQTECKFTIEIFNEQHFIRINEEKIKFICKEIICDAGVLTGSLRICLVDNAAIRAINSKYLGYDCVTDVLSFDVERTNSLFEGELVVSAEVAKERCREFDWDDESELLLYVIHGTLHLMGYDDKLDYTSQHMKQKEVLYLHQLGILLPNEKETLL